MRLFQIGGEDTTPAKENDSDSADEPIHFDMPAELLADMVMATSETTDEIDPSTVELNGTKISDVRVSTAFVTCCSVSGPYGKSWQ